MKDRLMEFMRIQGLTASKLAEIVDVQPSAISHILSGRNKPGYDFLAKLFTAYPDLNPRWIMLDQSDPTVEYQISIQHHPQEEAKVESDLISNVTSLDESPIKAEDTKPSCRKINLLETGFAPQETSKTIDRILILYSDGSFDTYN